RRGIRGGDDGTGAGDAEAGTRGRDEAEPGRQRVAHGDGRGGGGGAGVTHHQRVDAVLADGEPAGVAFVEADVAHPGDGGRVAVLVVGGIEVGDGAHRGLVGDRREGRGAD